MHVKLSTLSHMYFKNISKSYFLLVFVLISLLAVTLCKSPPKNLDNQLGDTLRKTNTHAAKRKLLQSKRKYKKILKLKQKRKWNKGKKKKYEKKKKKTWLNKDKSKKKRVDTSMYKMNNKFKKWKVQIDKQWKKAKKDDSCQCGVSPIKRTRIVNGQEATPNKYPWIVAMMNGYDDYYCGASILSDKWVLTAAHCVYDEGKSGDPNAAKDMYVRVGDHHMQDPADTKYTDTFSVKQFFYHEKYDPDTTDNDIALLELEQKIDFSQFDGRVLPICLPEAPNKYYGKKVTVAGWGMLKDNGAQSKVLMELDVDILWMRDCRNNYSYKKNWISPRMMCTFEENADACQGDSGGPLIIYNETRQRYEQVGVVSWGIGCASPEYPGVFVKLSHFIRWILERTKKSTFCTG